MEKIDQCPVCQGSSFSNYLNVEDFTVSRQEFKIQQCNTCNFLLTNPRPAEAEIGAFYQSDAYISHHDDAKDLMSRVYGQVRNYTLQQKLKMINELVPAKGSLLDIGCGTGAFLHTCQQDGWKIIGTEPDPDARLQAEQKVGSPIHAQIQGLPHADNSFDIISMWHVLEHVHRLNETLSWLRSKLKTSGKILIAVPNPESHDAQVFGKYWAAYDVPRHLYHFTKNTMNKLLANHGLLIHSIQPMWFDAFYVSMLSTKYQSGNTDLIRSLSTGIKSNFKGRKRADHRNNTSSLIYIITKK
ncbi:class I SAM-dependent methyltransferase [Dyadobacter tibetensis]|uniref:class I SAM-dependent methyltransferase n=1 Tax=Dyadobacter tibetensis TaxID=1211851 RepID=UPI0004B83261|nr:class I SAM-dependent methyltransferase [Dyadobacter tibetensis]